jgi:hypothetical protein
LPVNKASITRGRAGVGEDVAVGGTAGVAVSTKVGAATVGLLKGGGIKVISGDGREV